MHILLLFYDIPMRIPPLLGQALLLLLSIVFATRRPCICFRVLLFWQSLASLFAVYSNRSRSL